MLFCPECTKFSDPQQLDLTLWAHITLVMNGMKKFSHLAAKYVKHAGNLNRQTSN